MAATRAPSLPTFAAFTGLRNDIPAERLGDKDLVAATNVDIDDSGAVSRRDGYAAAAAAAGAHSLWANADGTQMYFVHDGMLQRLDAGVPTATALASGLAPLMPMSYWEHAGRIYHANGLQTGVVENGTVRAWGIRPPQAPALRAVGGGLSAGTYQVVYTYVAADGQESGCGAATPIELPTGGGIFVALAPSSNPRVTLCRLYCTTPNGEQLYWAGDIANGDLGAVIGGSDTDLQRPLLTQFYGPPPAGQIVSFYNGRMLVAKDDTLHYSAPFGLELFRPTNSIRFASRITLVAPTLDGIFLSDSQVTYWMSGADMAQMDIRQRQKAAAIEGTLVYAPSGRIGELQGETLIPVWLTDDGVTVGTPGGTLNVMTEKYRFDAPARGAGLFRKNGETYQYLASFMGD